MNIIFKYMFFVANINNDYLIVRPNTQKILLQPIIFFPKSKNTGIKSAKAMMEKTIPPMTPMAKANQKTSSLPSKRNGMRPSTVLTMVSIVGTILRLKALR